MAATASIILKSGEPLTFTDVLSTGHGQNLIFYLGKGVTLTSSAHILALQSDLIRQALKDALCNCGAANCASKYPVLHVSLPDITKTHLKAILDIVTKGYYKGRINPKLLENDLKALDIDASFLKKYENGSSKTGNGKIRKRRLSEVIADPPEMVDIDSILSGRGNKPSDPKTTVTLENASVPTPKKKVTKKKIQRLALNPTQMPPISTLLSQQVPLSPLQLPSVPVPNLSAVPALEPSTSSVSEFPLPLNGQRVIYQNNSLPFVPSTQTVPNSSVLQTYHPLQPNPQDSFQSPSVPVQNSQLQVPKLPPMHQRVSPNRNGSFPVLSPTDIERVLAPLEPLPVSGHETHPVRRKISVVPLNELTENYLAENALEVAKGSNSVKPSNKLVPFINGPKHEKESVMPEPTISIPMTLYPQPGQVSVASTNDVAQLINTNELVPSVNATRKSSKIIAPHVPEPKPVTASSTLRSQTKGQQSTQTDTPSTAVEKLNRPGICLHCKQQVSDLSSHLVMVHYNDAITANIVNWRNSCSICKVQCPDKISLLTHLVNDHDLARQIMVKMTRSDPSDARLHSCRSCGQKLAAKNMGGHLADHFWAGYFKTKKGICLFCPFSSGDRDEYVHHIMSHEKARRNFSTSEGPYMNQMMVNDVISRLTSDWNGEKGQTISSKEDNQNLLTPSNQKRNAQINDQNVNSQPSDQKSSNFANDSQEIELKEEPIDDQIDLKQKIDREN